jgi:hypothetical protein
MTRSVTQIAAATACWRVGRMPDPPPYPPLPGKQLVPTANGSLQLPPMPLRQVRVVRAGWYGPDRKPVVLGEVVELPADEAYGAVALGRAEYAK